MMRLAGNTRLMTVCAALASCVVLGAAIWLAGCSRNDPFDPESVTNSPPTARIFVAPPEPGAELNPTSYFQRTFNWSGTDRDGWVREYYVSIRSDRDQPAPWDTTSRTDTTMSFVPDNEGNAEATIYLACRDDRGAFSDTVVQFIPMRNFPPAVNFQSDFEPLTNMQREVTDNGGAAPDTVFWNWGPSHFRLFAFDLDGAVTMDPFYRYTLVDGEPTVTWDDDDPAADPETGWVRVPFATLDEIKKFELMIDQVAPGPRTLTISVGDEASADTRFIYEWEVRAPQGPVLYVTDNTPSLGRDFWGEALDSHLGDGNWQTYTFFYGYPDQDAVLLETMRLFDAVIWSGGSTSPMLLAASDPGGVIGRYVEPVDGEDPGRFLLATANLVGTNSSISPAFLQNVLGVLVTTDPQDIMDDMNGSIAEAHGPGLVDMACTNRFSRSFGMLLLEGADTEPIMRMEQCVRGDCHGSVRFDIVDPPAPIVVVRRPSQATTPVARVVAVSLDMHYFERVDAVANVGALLEQHLGVAP